MKRISYLLDLKHQAIEKVKRDPTRADKHMEIARAVTQRIREIIVGESIDSDKTKIKRRTDRSMDNMNTCHHCGAPDAVEIGQSLGDVWNQIRVILAMPGEGRTELLFCDRNCLFKWATTQFNQFVYMSDQHQFELFK